MVDTQSNPDNDTRINTDDIEKYFSFLAGMTNEKEIFTYCLMDKESESVIPGYGVMHGKSEELIKTAKTNFCPYPEIGTLHVCLNRTNLKGRRKENITGPRVLCCDIDTQIDLIRIRYLITNYSPGMVVESSPGKYHLYWKIDSSIPLVVWSELQLGLAELLGGDYALSQVTHTIRVPGVPRIKDGETILPRIVYLDPKHVELTCDDIYNLIPDLPASAVTAKEKIAAQNKELKKAVKAALKDKPINPNPGSMGRNSYLFHYLKEWSYQCKTEITYIDLFAAAERVNSQFLESLSGVEVELVVQKVWKRVEATCEERKEKRAETLNQLVIELPVADNGTYVNGANRNGSFHYDFTQDLKLKDAPYTDLGIIRRVLQRFGSFILSTGNLTYAFDERIPGWQPQKAQKDVLAQFVGECVNDLIAEPEFLRLFCLDDEGLLSDKMRARAIAKFCSNYTVSSTVSRLLSHPDVRKIAITEFDKNPDKIQWANGLLDMSTAEFRAPIASDLLLHRSDVSWQREATCEGWKEFLAQVFAENDDPDGMCGFMQELFGYTLSGRMNVRKVFIHLGQGSNGKSKILGTLYKLLGRDYATLMGSGTVSKSKSSVAKEIERVGAKMEGKRLVLIDDLDSRTEWNEGLVKTMIGPNIVARNLYEEERDITNQAKFHIGCNTAPDPQEENIGILRRLCIIPYPRLFKPDDSKEEAIDAMIEGEMSGIAQWAVEGYRRLRERGSMSFPEEVSAKTDEYRREHFTKENAVLERYSVPVGDEGEWISLSDLLEEVNGSLPLGTHENVSSDSLGRSLKALGFPSQRPKIAGAKVTQYQVVKK